MRIVMFYHTLLSDWNHGNAHFLRGIVSELQSRGHQVDVFEPHDSLSLRNLLSQYGKNPLQRFHDVYPGLKSTRYDLDQLDLREALDDADLVIVHEWNDRGLIRRIGEHRQRLGSYRLLFHDTHHRMVTDPDVMATFDLSGYDGVLANGEILRELYIESGRMRHAWVWHEAADTRVFRPLPNNGKDGDLIWIGNWGDGERTEELNEFLIQPCRTLSLTARVHGVRYPVDAVHQLADADIDYAGWLPNFQVPEAFAKYRVTVHIPRRPYVEALPGIPTIRVFEALACGIPLVCSPWEDVEGLFEPGEDFLVADNGEEMTHHLRSLLCDPELACELARHGLETILNRHTCAHRVDELLAIHGALEEKKEDAVTESTSSLEQPV